MATKIEWTRGDDGSPGETWNPVTGCDRVSPGCDNCYALTMSARLKAMGQPKYQRDGRPETSGPGFGVQTHPDVLDEPLRWRKPRRVFVNSMSDLFHPKVPAEFVADVFAVMSMASQHTFQVLTKRPQRMRMLGHPIFKLEVNAARMRRGVSVLPDSRQADGTYAWPLRNVWLGVSVEDQERADQRIPYLLDTPAAVRFVSCEPLLGPVDLSRWTEQLCLTCAGEKLVPVPGGAASCPTCHVIDSGGRGTVSGLDWVIVGGESGPGARPMHPAWARQLRDQAIAAGAAFFFKQWGSWEPVERGGIHPGDVCLSEDGLADHADDDYVCFANESDGTVMRRVGGHGGRELDGDTWDQWPDITEVPA